jgi:hypothetical protein
VTDPELAARLRQPTAAPNPVRGQRIDERTDQESEAGDGHELAAFERRTEGRRHRDQQRRSLDQEKRGDGARGGMPRHKKEARVAHHTPMMSRGREAKFMVE